MKPRRRLKRRIKYMSMYDDFADQRHEQREQEDTKVTPEKYSGIVDIPAPVPPKYDGPPKAPFQ